MDVPFTVIIRTSATKINVTYYLLQVQQDEDEEMSYAVDRRFTEFVELEESLRNIYGSYVLDQIPSLPKKTFMRQNSDAFVKKRHYYLQQFINGIHEIPFLVQSKVYRTFLKLDSFFPSSIPIRPFLKFVQNKSQHGIRLSNFNMIMLSHNVFISIAGCHPEIAFCSAEKILTIQNRINATNATKNTNKSAENSKANLHKGTNNGHRSGSPLMKLPNSPMSGRMANDLTNSPTSSMSPSPTEWGGCIQIWYYDTTAMNSSGNFSWWLEERGDDNKNFYGWNKSKGKSETPKKSLYDERTNQQTMDSYSYYGGADDMPTAQHELQTNTESGLASSKVSKNLKRKRMKEVHRELDCIFLSEVPTSLYYDREYQQLFVGTLMGNIHRFKIIHNAKIEATGILPNPNIYNNVSNIHSYCHSSIYTYIHHSQFANENKMENKQRIHQRLYEQRELLKLKERQLHHKRAKKKRALIPDNDAIYNKAILNMQSFDGVLYVSDACANIHAFDITEFKHLHYVSLDHYFVDILQTEYKTHVDEYYKRRLNQYRAQHERMMSKNEPKDIHTLPPMESYNKDILNMDDDSDDNNDNAGGLFSQAFLKNRNKGSAMESNKDETQLQNELKSYGLQKEHENTLGVGMRIGAVEKDTAYEMYFDELVFSTTVTKQKEKILNVTNKLNQDIIVTDLVRFEDLLFIPTNLPRMTLEHLRYPSQFNTTRPKISVSAVETNNSLTKLAVESDKKESENDEISYNNPYKGQRYKPQLKTKSENGWERVISDGRESGEIGCDNVFGTVSNFDSSNDVIYSIPTIHTIHKDFLIYNKEGIRANVSGDANDMSAYNQCTIFVWGYTTHISVDMNRNVNKETDEDTQARDYGRKRTEKRKKKKQNIATKERTWYFKEKWFDATVDCMLREFVTLTYCTSIKTLAVAGVTGYIALYNAVGICFNIFFAHTDTITKMIFLEGQKQLVSTGLDGTIKIWNLYHSQFAINVNPNPNEVLDDVEDEMQMKKERIERERDSAKQKRETQSNVQYLNKKVNEVSYKESKETESDHLEYEDTLPDLGIADDDDLADLYHSNTDNLNINDYDPFGDKAFDDYLDKRGQSFKEKSENYYKPTKPQKTYVSSKQLLAAHAPKAGFKTVKKGQKMVSQASPKSNVDDMADIESYILQQNRSNSPLSDTDMNESNPFGNVQGSDNSPKPEIIDRESSPEVQINAALKVVKKTKPKRKKKKDKKDKKDRKKKDKKKRKKKKEKRVMEPEDCTIRYGKEQTYTGRISQKISAIRGKSPRESSAKNESTNPFDTGMDNGSSVSVSVNVSAKNESTNPFGNSEANTNSNPFGNTELNSTNPFATNENVQSQTQTQKLKSTNPFADDLP